MEARTAHELAEARAALVEELEAKNEELDAFSYSVAHDLRAPLRSIDGFSLALLEDYAEKLDDDGREYLRFIRESAQHMAQLIDDLLALSRVTRSDFQRERSTWRDRSRRCSAARRGRARSPGRVRHCRRARRRGRCQPARDRSRQSHRQRLEVSTKRPQARIEVGATRAAATGLLRARQRGRLRHGLCVEALRRVPAAALGGASSRAPESAWPPSSASFAGTAGAFGPKATSTTARHSSSRFEGGARGSPARRNAQTH